MSFFFILVSGYKRFLEFLVFWFFVFWLLVDISIGGLVGWRRLSLVYCVLVYGSFFILGVGMLFVFL